MLFLFIIMSVHGATLSPTGGIGFEEVLMSNAGLARTGSTGAVNTNPSLLGWVPEEEHFTNTNTIQFYRFERQGDDPAAEASPSVLPLYSASTARSGSWGYGWAISTQELKVRFVSFENGFAANGNSQLNNVNVAGALAKRWNDSAFGLRLALVRSAVESETQFTGTSSGFDFIGHSREREELWSLDARIGWTTELSERAVLSLGVAGPVALLSAREDSNQSSYNEAEAQTTSSRSRTLPGVVRTHALGTGFAYKFDVLRSFVDISWSSPEAKSEQQGRSMGQWGATIGAELPLERTTLFTGVSFIEADRVAGEANDPASFNLSSGFKRQHKHASTIYGLSWQRDFASGEAQIVSLLFGTKFAY
jgi:hypothetical protein